MSKGDFQHASATPKQFFDFINERHRIYLKKAAGQLRPWTDDPVLHEFKFTNVFRELDKGTVFLRTNTDAPFHIMVYRMINNRDTFIETGFPSDWEVFKSKLRARRDRGVKVFTSAHMTVGKAFEDKLDTVLQTLDEVHKDIMDGWDPFKYPSMQECFEDLLHRRYFGIGPFIAYEIVCDFRFAKKLSWPDMLTWANVGPGAKRGLQRLGLPPTVKSMVDLYVMAGDSELLEPHVARHHVSLNRWNDVITPPPPFELREIEHSLCEFDKYERARTGQGRPREKYA
jgi:hypothetical protein